MSKRGYISRYLLLLKKLKVKPYSTYEELQKYLENQIEYLQMYDDELNLGFSKRTLQRDLKEIRNLFGIEIEYSKREKGYFINHTEYENNGFQRMMESFDLFHSLNFAQDLKPFIHIEKQKPLGTENLLGLLHAIKNTVQIEFTYYKFEDEEFTLRKVEPYAIKEFKNRWYLLAKDNKDNVFKSFALDRLSDLEISSKKFKYPTDYDLKKSYEFSFGIVSPNGENPQDIILSFEPYQGKYIKTMPLHHSQKIITDNELELKIKLRLCLSYDLFMEILYFGDRVRVIAPQVLADQVKQAHEKAYKRYI